jgi:predicted DCC family thiol-disulfide oxidoreductase YuxK
VSAPVSVYRWLNDAPRQRLGIAAFQRLLAVAVLFRIATEFRFAGFLWGPDSISSVKGANGLDWFFASTERTQALLVIEGLAAGALLFQKYTQLATVLLFASFSTLMFRTVELSDGGDNLTYLALMGMCLALPAGTPGRPGSVRVWLHNLAVVAILFQVCVVYLIAGLAKAHGDTWNNGTALYLIAQVEWFSAPSTRPWFSNGLVATAAAYSTVLFQVWFPIAMLSQLKGLFLFAAFGFHFGIAVSMGLISFSLVMAGADLSLITDEEYRRLGDRMRGFLEQLRRFGHRRWVARATLYLDGSCAVCARLGRVVARADAFKRLDVKSFRESTSFEQFGIEASSLEERMHLVVHEAPAHVVLAGADAAELLCWRLPAGWLLLPGLVFARLLGVGPKAYDALARRRFWFGRVAECAGSCSRLQGKP